MTSVLRALLTHARTVPADQRAAFADRARSALPPGSVLVETCHRVEVYGGPGLSALIAVAPAGAEQRAAHGVARHLVQLAVGRDSAVVAEDQVLHQLRTAVQRARRRGPLAPGLDRLFDVSLRAGRRARSWLPAKRLSLADLALERVIGRTEPPSGRVLVVGAGEMGRRAAHALSARGTRLIVTSRTPERAQALAEEVTAGTVPFDPGPEPVAELAGVVIALAGGWTIEPATADGLARSASWVIDLSAPPAVAPELARRLGARLTSVDDLAVQVGPAPSARLVARLDALVEQALAEFELETSRQTQRGAARALAEKAAAAQSAELDALWQRVPALEPAQRAEVERMAHHLIERLLREPLELLHEDDDGRRARAARELFRL